MDCNRIAEVVSIRNSAHVNILSSFFFHAYQFFHWVLMKQDSEVLSKNKNFSKKVFLKREEAKGRIVEK